MKRKLREWLLDWLGLHWCPKCFGWYMPIAGQTAHYCAADVLGKTQELSDEIKKLDGRIEDLEEAYPDYKKAKAKADDEKANEIVPGFTPFTQRKRQWEATRRRPQKKS